MNKKSKDIALQPDTAKIDRLAIPAFIAIITWIILSPVVGAGFINWDDPSYVQYNEYIRHLNFNSLKHFFSSYFLGNYHPMTLLVYSIEFSLFGEAAKGYHIMNLLLHISNTLLVYFIFMQIRHTFRFLPAIIALLFAVHPMHVESVAWISELKDMLYTLFLLVSILFYLKYTRGSSSRFHFGLSMLFFILSLLSKGQAVVLPLLLLVIDFMEYRKPGWKLLWEKVPFFLLSLLFGIIAIQAQGTAVNEAKIGLTDQVLFRFEALLMYLFKSIVPLQLSGFHEFPYNSSGQLSWFTYISPLLAMAIMILIFRYRRFRYLAAGFLFFLLAILPVILVPVGKSFIAERYSYISYLGLFIIFGGLTDASWFGNLKPSVRKKYMVILPLILILFGVQSYLRAGKWESSLTFWTDVSKKYPRSLIAREHLAMYYYYEGNDLQAAIREMESATGIDRSYAHGYRLLGFYYQQAASPEASLKALTRCLELDSSDVDAWFYRGNSFKDAGMFREALLDYTKALEKDPGRNELWNARGSLFLEKLHSENDALKDFRKAYALDSTEVNVLHNLAITFYSTGQFDSTLFYGNKATANGFANTYYVKSLAYYKKQDYPNARNQAELARESGIQVPDSLLISR